MTHVSETTANDMWLRYAELFSAKQSGWLQQPSRAGVTRELLHAGFTIADPRQRWITSRTPAMNPAFALAEAVWIINGRNDSTFVNAFFPGLPDFQGEGAGYPGAYGFRLRRHFGVDQIVRSARVLAENPDSRQVVLQIWDPVLDLPSDEGTPRSCDIPCNVCSILKIRSSKLEWLQIMRSNDLWRGTPHNVVQFTMLQEVMAGWLGFGVGEYSQMSDSLHLYESDAKYIRFRGEAPVNSTDRFVESMDESLSLFATIAKKVDYVLNTRRSDAAIEHSSEWPEVPSAYRNILLVLLAELARRREYIELANDLVLRCTNPAYVQLWDRWTARGARKALSGL